jgi:uncharacterized protein YkwD
MLNWSDYWSRDYSDLKKNKIILTALVIAIISGFFLLFLLTPKSVAMNFNEISATELVFLTNQERIGQNLPALLPNNKLTEAAKNKALDILKKQYFSHNSPNGKKFSAWVKETDYPYIIVGENLAMGFGSSEEIIKAWMNSQKHRQNILMPKYREIGIAVIKGELEGQNSTVVVQYFGAASRLEPSRELGRTLETKAKSTSISEILMPGQNIFNTSNLIVKV